MRSLGAVGTNWRLLFPLDFWARRPLMQTDRRLLEIAHWSGDSLDNIIEFWAFDCSIVFILNLFWNVSILNRSESLSLSLFGSLAKEIRNFSSQCELWTNSRNPQASLQMPQIPQMPHFKCFASNASLLLIVCAFRADYGDDRSRHAMQNDFLPKSELSEMQRTKISAFACNQ